MDKTDKNSQCLETYAMRKMTESEREAKDQIKKQVEGCMKHAPNGREESQTARDWDPNTHEQTASDWDPRTHEKRAQPTAGGQRLRRDVECEGVKPRYGDDAEKPINDDAKKTLVEATHLLERVGTIEQDNPDSRNSQNHAARNAGEAPGAQQGEREEYTELRVFAAKFKKTGRSSAIATGRRITERQHSLSSELLWRSRTKRARLTRG